VDTPNPIGSRSCGFQRLRRTACSNPWYPRNLTLMKARETKPRRRVYDDDGDSHFITFSCNGRRKLLNQDRCKRIVISKLESTRGAYDGLCFGFVIMPEHVHVLIRFREKGQLSLFKQEWKRQSSVALVEHFTKTNNPVLQYVTDSDGHHQMWIPKQHDFNVWSRKKAVEKLEYMHRNPVERGLCEQPEDWPFSSARWYALLRSVGVTLTHIDE